VKEKIKYLLWRASVHSDAQLSSLQPAARLYMRPEKGMEKDEN